MTSSTARAAGVPLSALDTPAVGYRRLRRVGVWLAAGLVLVLALVAGALIGPAGLTPGGVLLELVGALPGIHVDSGLSAQQQAILWQIRLPRVVLGALVGATLAVSGAAYQGVFRNPLADPYLLGVSAGAGLGATIALTVQAGSLSVPLSAFIGFILAMASAAALPMSPSPGATIISS